MSVAVARANEPGASDPIVLFVTTRYAGVLRSDNGGASWAGANGGLPVAPLTSLALHQERVPLGAPVTIYETTLYAGSYSLYTGSASSGVFRSTDLGATWTSVSDGLTSLDIYDLKTDEMGIVYAATGTGLFRSLDRGDSWEGPLLNPCTRIAIDPTAPSRLYAGSDGDLFRSADGGTSWNDTNLNPAPGSANVTVGAIGIDPFDPSTLFVQGTLNVMFSGLPPQPTGYVTRDRGTTWTTVDGIAMAGAFVFPQPNTVLASQDGVTQSNDHGQTRFDVSGGLPGGYVNDLQLDPFNADVVYAATGAGVFRESIHPQP